ncbi:MAG: hypothetical protein K1X75_04090 [Leptospirales bacterium]|nr:hypothetical protein [Leptospirales bacterium]
MRGSLRFGAGRKLALLLSIAASFFGCNPADLARRLHVPARPRSVPESATLDRTRMIWTDVSAEGEVKVFFYGGELASRGQLIDGKAEGEWESFLRNGRVAARGRYRNGLRDGVWQYLDDQGRLYLTVEYRSAPRRLFGMLATTEYGNENGPYRRYFPDGKVEEEGQYWSGYYHGPVRRFHRNGRPAITGAYAKDQPTGEWRFYFPDGRLERVEHYQNGKLEGALQNYFPDGRLYHETTYRHGVEIGPKRIQAY